MKSLILLCAAGTASMGALAAPSDPATQKATEASADAVGSITGTFKWAGDRPEAKPAIVMGEQESQGCDHGSSGADTADRTLIIDDMGGVANVVVTLEVAGMKAKVPAEPVVLDQHGCRFEPHVVVVPVGATLLFDNSDSTNHNIHTYARKNQAMNKNVAGGSSFEQVMEMAETIEVKCDIHPWMKGYVHVTDASHWALTTTGGSFEIHGVPPGEYTLSWWHEELGKGKTEKVTVAGGAAAAITHELGEAKKAATRRRR